MNIEFQGKAYDFDQNAISLDEFREMKRKYKRTAKGFEEGITEGDPDALTCLYWVMEARQSGNQSLVLSDSIDFPGGATLYQAMADAAKAEQVRSRRGGGEAGPYARCHRPLTASPSPPASAGPWNGTPPPGVEARHRARSPATSNRLPRRVPVPARAPVRHPRPGPRPPDPRRASPPTPRAASSTPTPRR